MSNDIGKQFNGNYSFWDLVDLFEQAGLLRRKGAELIIPDENARFMINGG